MTFDPFPKVQVIKKYKIMSYIIGQSVHFLNPYQERNPNVVCFGTSWRTFAKHKIIKLNIQEVLKNKTPERVPPHICLQETFYYFILAFLAKERKKQQY